MRKLILCCALVQAAQAQGTRDDYARAEKFISRDPIVFEGTVTPNWIEKQERFWYRRSAPDGTEFLMVDAPKAERAPAFDHARLAAALSRATGRTYAAKKLPFERFDLIEKNSAIRIEAAGLEWTCTLAEYE
ncbi:MAG: S9 family peptidase, partial [Bryobacteraceae bacterium]